MKTAAVPKAIPNHCDMATELVPTVTKNDHQMYRIVNQIASRDLTSTDITAKDFTWRSRGCPGAIPYQVTN
jgi:hypothetical protein